MTRLTAALILWIVTAAACSPSVSSDTAVQTDTQWPHYGGDAGGTKYSALAQIERRNVEHLEPAWTVRTGEADLGGTCENCGDTQVRFEVTPLMLAGMLFLSTPRNRVLALDPANGATRWMFDPRIDVTQPYTEDFTSRGVAAWSDQRVPPAARCARRIFLSTIDARLFALDAADGVPCEDFGERGAVQLNTQVGLNGQPVDPTHYSVTSPPAVVGDMVIVGSAIRGNSASGVVRAYDAYTGTLRWAFDPIPRTVDHPARAMWDPDAARTTGGANVWTTISADPERDLVFLPTSSAAPNYYGGGRPGRNDFANSVVALRASTGEVVWGFQVVHHDLWDYDVAAQPVLITLRREGGQVPAVVVGTKTGMIFVLHRETGEPLFPTRERPVPRSDVPGEPAWPTQPFPERPFPLGGTVLTPDSAFGITEADRTYCRGWIARLRNEGIFTPPSLQGTLVWPGYWGGINWSGMAWDPVRQLLVTPVLRMAMVVQLGRREDLWRVPREPRRGLQVLEQEGAPYAVTRMPLVAPSGMPCTPPPWGSLVALELANGSVRWRRPLGVVPWLKSVRGSEKWGSLVFGGPLVTAGGLVFVGASQDNYFRGFDIETGELLWDYRLPAGGQATPMTYAFNGRQYIVIVAGGHSGVGSAGDWIVAFALP